MGTSSILSVLPKRAPFRNVLTGSYHNYLRIFDVDTLNDVVLQADKSAFKAKKMGGPLTGNKQLGAKNGIKPGLKDAMQLEPLDFNKKILHASWHPRENTIAVCVLVWSVVYTRADIATFIDCCYEQSVLVQRRVNRSTSSPSSTIRALTPWPWSTMPSAHFLDNAPVYPLLSSFIAPFHTPTNPPLVCCTHHLSFSPSSDHVVSPRLDTHVAMQYETDGRKESGDGKD